MEKLKVQLDDQLIGNQFGKDVVEDYLYTLDSSNQTSYTGWTQYVQDAIDAHRDPRVDDWFLMNSPWETVALCALYLLIVMGVGPAVMKNRAPYNLKYTMMAYNLFQTILCGYVSLNGMMYWFGGEYNWMCQPVDYSDDPKAVFALRMSWWFFFSKFIDFFDSFFFVLRKKNNQLTALHIIHHSTLPMFCWFGPKFAGGGNTTFGGTFNMFVHVVMYFYYFLAATGIKREYLWWKRYLTSFQMVQFVIVFFHASIPLFLSDCNYPKEMCYMVMFNGALYLGLFWNFYKSEYKKPSLKKTQ